MKPQHDDVSVVCRGLLVLCKERNVGCADVTIELALWRFALTMSKSGTTFRRCQDGTVRTPTSQPLQPALELHIVILTLTLAYCNSRESPIASQLT